MATRLYFPSSGAASISPAFGSGWEQAGQADRLTMVTTRISSAMVNKGADHDGTSPGQILLRQYIVAGLGAQTLAGTIKGQLRGFKNHSAVEANLQVRVAKCASDGTSVVELLAITGSTDITEPPKYPFTTATNRRFEQGSDDFALDLTSTAITATDCLIVELGYTQTTGITARFATMVFGDDSGTDLPEDETTTAANNPWIEFSQTVTFGGGGSPAAILIAPPGFV